MSGQWAVWFAFLLYLSVNFVMNEWQLKIFTLISVRFHRYMRRPADEKWTQKAREKKWRILTYALWSTILTRWVYALIIYFIVYIFYFWKAITNYTQPISKYKSAHESVWSRKGVSESYMLRDVLNICLT